MQDQKTGIPFNQNTIPSSLGSVMPIDGSSDFQTSNRGVFPSDASDFFETLKKKLSEGGTSDNPAVQSPMGLQTQPSFLQNGYTPSSQNPIPAFRQPLFNEKDPLHSDTRSFSNYKSGNNDATLSSSLPTQFKSNLLSDKKRDTTSDNSLAQSGSRQWNFPPKNDPLSSPGPISALPRDTYAQAFSYNNNNIAATQQSSNSDKPIVITSKEAKKLYGKIPIPKDVKNAATELMEKLANQKNPPLPSQGDTYAPAFSYSPNNNAATKPSSLSNLPKTTTMKTVVNSNDLRKQFKDFNPPKEVKKMAGELMEKLNMEKNSQSSKIFK